MKQISVLFIILSLSVPASAAFLDTGWGARSQGMGGAFTAVADDASGPLYNPAGLAQVSRREAAFMSDKLFTGLDGVEIGQNFFGYVHPVSPRFGNVGFAWASLYDLSAYREDTCVLSYGKNITALSSQKINVALGASLRYLRHEYSLDRYNVKDPVFSSGYSADALSADGGVLVALPHAGLTFALASRNAAGADVGLRTRDDVPVENVAGAAYFADTLAYLGLPRFTFAMDVVSRDGVTDLRCGAESWLMDGKFALRAGGRSEEISMGLGYVVGFKKSSMVLVVDYAFGWPLEVEQTSGAHRMAVTVRFP